MDPDPQHWAEECGMPRNVRKKRRWRRMKERKGRGSR
jgi:hypothetical protein